MKPGDSANVFVINIILGKQAKYKSVPHPSFLITEFSKTIIECVGVYDATMKSDLLDTHLILSSSPNTHIALILVGFYWIWRSKKP